MRFAYTVLGLLLGLVVHEALHRGIGMPREATRESSAQPSELAAASSNSCAFAAQEFYDR